MRACIAVLALLPGLALARVPIELPYSVELDAPPLALKIRDAELRIEIRAGAVPTLEARSVGPGPPPELAWEAEEGLGWVLKQVEVEAEVEADAEPDQRPGGLRLLARLPPGFPIRLVAERGRIEIEGPDPRAEDLEETADQTPGLVASTEPPSTALLVALTESSLIARGGALGLHGQATESELWLRGVHGPLQFGQVGGRLELTDHHGSGSLRLLGGRASISGFEGALRLDAQDADLRLDVGRGNLEGAWVESDAEVRFWHGSIQLQPTNTRLAIYGSGEPDLQTPLVLTMTGGELAVDRIHGTCQLDLTGGRAALEEACDNIQAKVKEGGGLETRRSPRVTVEAVASEILLQEADFAGLQVEGGSVRLVEIGQLSLVGKQAELDGLAIHRLQKLEVTDSNLRLSLAEEGTSSTFLLAGRAEIEVDVRGACIVELLGRDSSLASQIYVDGCDLRSPGQGPRGRELLRRFGRERPSWLRVQLGPDARFTARGR